MEESNNNSEPNLIQQSLKTGLIYAIIGIILFLVFYIINLKLVISFTSVLISLVIFFGFYIYSGIQFRSLNGGHLSFGKAFRFLIVAMVLGGIISFIFSYVMFFVVDTDIPDQLAAREVEFSKNIASFFGAPEEALEKIEEEALPKVMEKYTIAGMFSQFLWGVGLNAIGALIIGAIVKKKKQEEPL